MKRLTHEADFGLEEWEQTLYSVNSDQGGAYNILDIANYKGEEEFDEILKTISLGLKHYEDIGLTPEQIRELVERDKPKRVVYEHGFEDSRLIYYVQRCKSCGEQYDPSEKFNFCPNCGQRLEQ